MTYRVGRHFTSANPQTVYKLYAYDCNGNFVYSYEFNSYIDLQLFFNSVS